MSEKVNIVPDNKIVPASAAADILPAQASAAKDMDAGNVQRLPIQRKLSIGAVDNPLEHEADAMADQVMRMPEQSFIQRKCAHCEEEEAQRKPLASFIQKKEAATSNTTSDATHTQIQATRGGGSAMPGNTKSFMESRFGTDFSNVRIHSGGYASQLSKELNAQAFTVGNDIYFNAGKFSPESSEGKRLLAHELTHTIQQKAASPANIKGRSENLLVQKAGDKTKDETAKKIIDAGKDTRNPIDQRAIDAVNSIIKNYYDRGLVDSVVYVEETAGLVTSPVGKGKDIKGKIIVGKYFINNIDLFARRVLQVGHELQHVQQQRSGMGGDTKRNEREFLAFYWETTEPDKAGTGRMSHIDHVSLIDEALRNYYCMPAEDQKTHAAKKDELLKLRATQEKASGHDHVDAPISCPDAGTKTKGAGKAKLGEKELTTQPGEQKVAVAKDDEGIKFAASTGIETQTKQSQGKSTTGVAGKFSFEMTIPFTDKLKLGPVSFFKEGGAKGSVKLNPGGSGPITTSLELQAAVKMVSLDFEKVKVPLGFADFGISASTLADADYNLSNKAASEKLGLGVEAEAKFKPGAQKWFYITVKGGIEKTYDKECNAEFKPTPLKWKTSLAVGVEF